MSVRWGNGWLKRGFKEYFHKYYKISIDLFTQYL